MRHPTSSPARLLPVLSRDTTACAQARPKAGLVTGLALALAATPLAHAADAPTIAGDYVCRKGCRATDAPPSISIKGPIASCMSELGGIYTGRSLSPVAVFCFKMVGTLSSDGKTILWSNGNVWERRATVRRP